MSTLLEQKTWLSWISPLLPFPIFHLPQRRRTCVGKNNAHHTHATLHFLYSPFNTHMHVHTANALRQSLDFLLLYGPWFLPVQLVSVLFLIVLTLFLNSGLISCQCPVFFISPAHLLHPIVIFVVLCGWPTARERQVQKCRPNLTASPPKLHGTVPITLWPTKAFPGLAVVTRAPPPFAVVTGGVIRRLFYCNPKNVPAGHMHATGSIAAMFQ